MPWLFNTGKMSLKNARIRRYGHRIDSSDVDFSRKSTAVALGDHILHTAAADADANGLGVIHLNKMHNSSWVLTRFAFEVYRMPDEHEELFITTWVSDITRIMTTRNFEVFDAGGGRIAAAVSNWAMISLSTRRPLDLRVLDTYHTMRQEFDPPIAIPRKLGTFEERATFGRTVVYSDLDFNRHTNSMKYLQWVVDTLPLELLETKLFTRIDINFMLESKYGDILKISAGGEKNEYRFDILDEENKTICRIGIETN